MHKENNFYHKQDLFITYDKNYIIRSVSSHPVLNINYKSKKTKYSNNFFKLVGRKVPRQMLSPEDMDIKEKSNLRVAIVCNWNDQCGISTYSKYLTEALIGKVGDIKVFSEESEDKTSEDEPFVERCWKRGDNLLPLANRIKQWNPDFVIIQHEYGIYPNAFYFMQLMESLENIPYVVAMHSVYEHLDKLVYSEACKNIVVHTQQAKSVLQNMGNTSNIHVIPHGCLQFSQIDELWNIMRSPYTIMQFGFGFNYKGVDRAIEAIAHLKEKDEKFEDIHYFYLCSSNSHNLTAQNDYYEELIETANTCGVRDNISIIKKYQSDQMLSLYLRLAKVVVFPYKINGDNKVYAASGAIRLAMAHKKPVIASDSHLFDDVEGIIPRPGNHLELANEIDKIFSDEEYRSKIANDGYSYTLDNSWDNTANQYIDCYYNAKNQILND